jgi:plastocyanin
MRSLGPRAVALAAFALAAAETAIPPQPLAAGAGQGAHRERRSADWNGFAGTAQPAERIIVTQAGTYTYNCAVHGNQMTGRIVVR